jgi:hypothetical protein
MASPQFTRFKGELDRFRDELIPAEFSALRRRMATEFVIGVVSKTRVKTGRARGNWQAQRGSAPEGETGRLDPVGASTISAAEAVINAERPRGRGGRFIAEAEPIIIGNNVPYIGFLEDLDKMTSRTIAEIEARFP